jgi:Flp pilus assembly protein TadG
MIRPIQITRRELSTRRRRSWGGSVLEAAFIVPILVTLAFGMAEFSYFFFVKHTLEGAAREGARNAIVATSNASVTAAVNNSLTAAGANSWGAVISITDTSGNAMTISSTNPAAGTAIEVNVSCTWSTVGVHPLGIIPGSKQVIGTCVMRREG